MNIYVQKIIYLIIYLIIFIAPSSLYAEDVFEVNYTGTLAIHSGRLWFLLPEDLEPQVKSVNGATSFEMSTFHKKTLASYMGYRIAIDSNLGRAVYQSGYMGMKYFYLGLGMPIKSKRNNSLISQDILYKPYFSAGMSIGKILVQSSGEFNVLEVSSEFIGMQFNTGSYFSITDNFALDFNIGGEFIYGVGPLDVAAPIIQVLLGGVYYY